MPVAEMILIRVGDGFEEVSREDAESEIALNKRLILDLEEELETSDETEEARIMRQISELKSANQDLMDALESSGGEEFSEEESADNAHEDLNEFVINMELLRKESSASAMDKFVKLGDLVREYALLKGLSWNSVKEEYPILNDYEFYATQMPSEEFAEESSEGESLLKEIESALREKGISPSESKILEKKRDELLQVLKK